MGNDLKKPSIAYWLISVVAVQMGTMFGRGGSSQIGRSFQRHFWVKALHEDPNAPMQYEDREGRLRPVLHEFGYYSLWLRYGMDFFVNAITRHFVAFSVPLVLMHSKDSMEFVQNCMALAVLATIDDLKDGKIKFRSRPRTIYVIACTDSQIACTDGAGCTDSQIACSLVPQRTLDSFNLLYKLSTRATAS